jgi:hypothetical protein
MDKQNFFLEIVDKLCACMQTVCEIQCESLILPMHTHCMFGDNKIFEMNLMKQTIPAPFW